MWKILGFAVSVKQEAFATHKCGTAKKYWERSVLVQLAIIPNRVFWVP